MFDVGLDLELDLELELDDKCSNLTHFNKNGMLLPTSYLQNKWTDLQF